MAFSVFGLRQEHFRQIYWKMVNVQRETAFKEKTKKYCGETIYLMHSWIIDHQTELMWNVFKLIAGLQVENIHR